MPSEIRPMADNEIDTVLDIWQKENPIVHSFLDDEFLIDVKEKAKQTIMKSKVFVAAENSEILGFIAVSGNFIEYLFVKSDFQKKGPGKALLKPIKKIFWSLMVKVYQKNTNAVAFFEKQYFFARDKMDNAETGECELCMEWIR